MPHSEPTITHPINHRHQLQIKNSLKQRMKCAVNMVILFKFGNNNNNFLTFIYLSNNLIPLHQPKSHVNS